MPSQVGVTGCFGGQGLFMPANEYVKMLRSLLVNDGKLLQGKSMELLFAPSLEPEAHTFVSTTLAEIMATSPLGAGLPKESKRDYSLGGLLAQQDQPGWYRDGTITWFIDRKTGLCALARPSRIYAMPRLPEAKAIPTRNTVPVPCAGKNPQRSSSNCFARASIRRMMHGRRKASQVSS
jgi:hypothetical protein